MKTARHLAGSIVLTAALCGTAAAQQTVAPPQRARGAVQQPLRDAAKAAKQAAQQPRNPAANQDRKIEQQRNLTANAVVARYIGGFQKNVGLTDEQTQNFSDVLGKYVRRQITLAQNRTDALKRLKDLTEQGAAGEDIQTQNKTVEDTEMQLINSERRFYKQMDMELTPQQQGKLKVYMSETAQDIRLAIQKSAQ